MDSPVMISMPQAAKVMSGISTGSNGAVLTSRATWLSRRSAAVAMAASISAAMKAIPL
ncbi:hypothetical protein D9M69_499350 [compost metagenome]